MGWRTLCAITVMASLTACFDFGSDAKFADNGSARVTLEIGVSAQLLAITAGLKKDGETVKDPFAECEVAPNADKLPPTVTWVKGARSQRGEMLVCTMTFDVADPVAATNWKRPSTGKDEPSLGLADPALHLERIGDKGYRMSMALQPKQPKPSSDDSEKIGQAMAAAMFANRFLTISVNAARIENTTGELKDNGRKVVWKIPMLALIQPTPGYQQDVKADIIYRVSMLDRALRAIGLD